MQPSEAYWDQLWQNGFSLIKQGCPPFVGWTLCNLRECGNCVCIARHLCSQRYHCQEQRGGAPLQGFSASLVFCSWQRTVCLMPSLPGGQESEAEHYARVWTLLGSGAVWTILVPKEVTPQCCSPSHPFYLGR